MRRGTTSTSYRLSDDTMDKLEKVNEKWGLNKTAAIELGVKLLDRFLAEAPKSLIKSLLDEESKLLK